MKKLLKNVETLSVLLITTSFLVSCAKGNSSSNSCPKPIFYREEFQIETDKALKRANEPTLYKMISDYGDLREELRQ